MRDAVKRISMGTDALITDGRLADLLTEYARQLARAKSSDTVVLPVARNGEAEEATVLLGPASQITLTESHDDENDGVLLPGLDDMLADLADRLNRLAGHGGLTGDEQDEGEPLEEGFPDFERSHTGR